MQDHDLTLVGLTEDRQRLVLVSDAGEEFTLAADARLRAALRGEHARLGQLEITMDSALRPRDIQARIRAGESPEAVAAAAQTTLDRVMTYATPVLAERAHIADRAQRASVRRVAGDGPARLLAEAVAERLRTRNIDPDTVEWDSWRREDGRWTLVADYRSGERPRHAEFVFDTAGRYVVAEDDEARWLVGEQSGSHGPQPRASGGTRRPAGHGADVELPLGEDAIEMVTEPPFAVSADADWMATQATERPVELGSEADEPDRVEASPPDAVGDEEPTVEVTGTGSPLRWHRPGDAAAATDVPPAGAAGPDAGDDAGDDAVGERPAQEPTTAVAPVDVHPAGMAPTDGEPAEVALTDGGPVDADTAGTGRDDEPTQPGAEPEASQDESGDPAPRRPQRKKGRASVPSWDEIMFGGGGKPE